MQTDVAPGTVPTARGMLEVVPATTFVSLYFGITRTCDRYSGHAMNNEISGKPVPMADAIALQTRR